MTYRRMEEGSLTEERAVSGCYPVSSCYRKQHSHFHHHRGLEFIAIRLGWFEKTELLEEGLWINNVWILPDDAIQLFQRASETPGIGYAIVNGTSKTPCEVLSLESAKRLLNYVFRDEAKIAPVLV